MLRLTHPDQVPHEVRRRGTAVTIGTFDGLHRGHRAVLDRLTAEAREHDLASVVLTFHPHPLEVLHPERAPEAVCSLAQRLELLESAGVDVVVAQEFTHELAAQGPREFVEGTYVRDFGMRRIVVGRDSRFGRGNAGTVDTLRELGEEFGFEVVVLEDRGESGVTRWSSTAVRSALRDGRVDLAAEHLGRPHTVRGTVVHGDHRGRELGFPTANLSADAEGMVPADGVYAGWLVLDDAPDEDPGRRLPAAISVGSNPTFDGQRRTVEAHVIDRTGLDLYGRSVGVEFVQRLRGMVRFGGIEPLVEQMTADVAEAREVLS
ncbi:bifunctional riboflavin kinase/FAD synthetase [Kytococcus schroeteri]|uniref:Riboflavin biosynthesis protein n=1 Tax=Kytococcus schroeteri TaxID=138300 RepID=A0A2I1PBB3_9MICO|nr:bifunctional riboflavin kinase/FAD synthetase [Kytococcus schroeteri]PKZ41918.1 bifunctional riboflavin kinase/FAD synthetase [Kytococcus schroeteri]